MADGQFSERLEELGCRRADAGRARRSSSAASF